MSNSVYSQGTSRRESDCSICYVKPASVQDLFFSDITPAGKTEITNFPQNNLTSPPILPRFLLLVLVLAPRSFSPGTPVFPCHQNSTFPNSNSIRRESPYCKIISSWNRPLSLGGHVESQENKKLCFCMASLVLNSRLA